MNSRARFVASISTAHKLSVTNLGSLLKEVSNKSPRLCAGSLDINRTRLPKDACFKAVAAEVVDLPTPPLPVIMNSSTMTLLHATTFYAFSSCQVS